MPVAYSELTDFVTGIECIYFHKHHTSRAEVKALQHIPIILLYFEC